MGDELWKSWDGCQVQDVIMRVSSEDVNDEVLGVR